MKFCNWIVFHELSVTFSPELNFLWLEIIKSFKLLASVSLQTVLNGSPEQIVAKAPEGAFQEIVSPKVLPTRLIPAIWWQHLKNMSRHHSKIFSIVLSYKQIKPPRRFFVPSRFRVVSRKVLISRNRTLPSKATRGNLFRFFSETWHSQRRIMLNPAVN